MIFVTLGSQKFQLNRLLKKIDELIEDGTIKEEVFAQTGYSDYKPVNYQYKQFLDRYEFSGTMDKCDTVITHGGTGAIIGAVKMGKKVIAVPRLAIYGEHVDDHQLQLIEQFKDLDIIYGCEDCEELEYALTCIEKSKFNQYKSNTQKFIAAIEASIEKL